MKKIKKIKTENFNFKQENKKRRSKKKKKFRKFKRNKKKIKINKYQFYYNENIKIISETNIKNNYSFDKKK